MSEVTSATVEGLLDVTPGAGVFSGTEIEGCDEPVQRYFRAAIAPGTPLGRAAKIRMHGSMKIGKWWVPFRARELLAPLHGYLWPATVAGGVLRGSDWYAEGAASMTWKLLGVVPVIRAGGADVARSAIGRAAVEGVWVPTALLPRFGVGWQARDERHIAADIPIGAETLTVRITLDDEGGVRSVHLERWGDPDGKGQYDWYPFGIEVGESRRFPCGITIPAEGAGGWFHDSDRWSDGEFMRYSIEDIAPVVGPTRRPLA